MAPVPWFVSALIVSASTRLSTLALAAASLGIMACASGDSAPRPHNLRGTALPEAIGKASFTLADTDGNPFDFRVRTDGKLTLLFFGYTYCPDVCPVHMANIANALRMLTHEQRSQVSVVFVTTDPERDTPQRLRSWLDAFDRTFVGLVGPLEDVNAIQKEMKLGDAYAMEGTEGTLPDSAGYLVAHAGQVLAFSPSDNLAHIAYPFGARQADWTHDIPILLELRW